ncbi:Lipase EstA/Esterase EstB family-containing protein [Aphelenchoides bicaudatus]|nr:Lipase EstA/Esterase EstB family-containing protein [Aphelenchoides bicaudatus]
MIFFGQRQITSITVLLIFASFLITTSNASLSNRFRRFLQENYGEYLEKELNRADMGTGGSFGGGNDHQPRTPTRFRPVILVHGITNKASKFDQIRRYFKNHQYGDEEVYGTTYGDGGQTNVVMVTMNCHYMKMLRVFIQAVADYTSSQVNYQNTFQIIGYSMGSPVSRKAIMGGKCVETGEDLGAPLTHLVNTFIGVAGANFGSYLCVIPFGSCNLRNGMACGSQFLNDINAKHRYEGKHVYTIYSNADDKVGFLACGRKTSEIVGEVAGFQKNGLNHDQVMMQTAELQYNLITYNHP